MYWPHLWMQHLVGCYVISVGTPVLSNHCYSPTRNSHTHTQKKSQTITHCRENEKIIRHKRKHLSSKVIKPESFTTCPQLYFHWRCACDAIKHKREWYTFSFRLTHSLKENILVHPQTTGTEHFYILNLQQLKGCSVWWELLAMCWLQDKGRMVAWLRKKICLLEFPS